MIFNFFQRRSSKQTNAIKKTNQAWVLPAVLCITISLPIAAVGQNVVPGDQAPAFQDAVAQWLRGDADLDALGQLSLLANDGNTAAQVLLARIGSHAHLIRDVTQDLPRKERVALLRQPGGLSGKSWLDAAAENSELARALRDSADRDARGDAVGPLYELGEIAVANRAFAALFNNGEGDKALEIVNSGVSLPPEAAYLMTQMVRSGQINADAYVGSASPAQSAGSEASPLSLIWAPIPPRSLLEDAELRDVAIEFNVSIPALTPLVELCQKHCSSEVAECSAAGAAELWGTDVMPFASPSEALLPNDVYWTSDRITTDVLRRLRKEGGRPNWDFYAPVSACFADMMTVL